MGHYDDHNAPAINMLTAQLLRYGWAAPRLRFLKQVPPQGYASGGRRNADLFRRAMSALTASRPSAYFEVAPGETWDKNLQMTWETLKDAEKRRITDRALSDTFVPWQEASGIRGDLASGVGGYKGYTNPGKIFRPENPDHIAHALNDLGETYAQDAMMGVGMQPFAGSSPTGLVSIQFPKGVEQDRVHDIYQRLMRRGLVEGHSTDMDAGVMSMLAGKGGRDTKRIAKGIDREVGGEYPVWAQRAHVSFPENRVNYGLYRDASSVRPETLWTGPGRAPEIGAPEEFKAASRNHVRSLIEEALGAPQGASALVGRAAGGRRNAANAALELAHRLGRLSPEGSGYQSVPGKPSTVDLPGFGRVEARPIPEIEDAAAGYARSRGLPIHTVDRFAPINPEFSGKVAREFDRMAHRPSDPLVRRAYDALIDDTLAQYRAAKDTGIDFRFLKPGQADPYAASPALGYEDIVNKGRLFVFPTDQGFGTLNKAAADNPLLRRVGRIGDKDDAVANDAFRIVHDLYGHYGPGNPFFRAPGEERAFQLHSRLYSPEAMPAATAETRGQNSWVNYGPAGEHNRRASPAGTIYADQKIGRMPSWTAAPPPAEGSDVEGYIRSLIRNGRARGGSLIQDRFPTHYLPGVGRQVMADGGAAPSMNDLMANVNSVFSRSSRPLTAADMTGVSPTYNVGRGAYTDAGGQKINSAFVTGMQNGYPVAPAEQAKTPTKMSSSDLLSSLFGGSGSWFSRLLNPTGYDKGGVARSIRAAQKALTGFTDPKTQYIDDWQWRPLSDVRGDISARSVPPHVRNFGNYMAEMSDKARTEGLDPEDVIKAYMITRSSIQREGRTPAKLASQGALIRPTSESLVRPEGQMAEFLQTPEGVRFLNEARKGDLSQDVVDAARRVMKPFGMSNAEPDAMDWARRNLVDRTPLVSDMVARAREGASPAGEWRDFTRDVKGIGPAKTGFIASLLGRGDLPTLDARQAILHTGMKNADVQDIMSKRSGRAGHEAVDRLAARQSALDLKLPDRLQPFYQHLAHHTIWDDVGNEKTTHQDIIDAMSPRAAGGRTGFGSGGWRQFADVVERAIERAKDVPVRHRLGVYHNVDAQHIEPLASRFNGIPAPSLAISKPNGNPVDNFGNSTLIGRPHLAIPTEENHVFGGDAYTPRFPAIYKANPAAGSPTDFMFKAPGDFTEVPVTVENVLNHMRARPLLGGEGPDAMGIGLLKTHLTPRPKSLEELQRNRYRIAEDEDVHGRDWAHYQNQLMTRGHVLGPYAHERVKYPGEQLTKAMIDFHNEGPSGLYRTYREDLPADQITGLKGMMRDIKALDPSYLEAKPLRNVGFDEFSAAILPNAGRLDRSGPQAADVLHSTGMPRENIHFYDDPNERFKIMRHLAPEHGFGSGGPVEQAMDIVRNADFEPRRMEPSAGEVGMLRRMAQASHHEGGPGVVEMADAHIPLPFGRSISLGQMPASTVRGVEMLAPIVSMGAQVAANFHPATRGASRALDLAQRLKFANDVRTTGHGDVSDFFSMLPGGKADMLGMVSAFSRPDHEPARDVLNRMREGRERGGRRQAAESLAKILQGFPEYPGKANVPLDEAYKFVVNPHHPSEDVSEAARDIIDKWGHNVASNKKGGYYNLEQTLAPQDVRPRIRQIPGVRPLDPRQMSWDDFYNIGKGGSFINIGGDRSNLGRLFGINGENLAWPVDLHAGPKYALEANPGAIWANAGNPAKSLQNAIMRAAENGPVYGILSPMSPQAVNSSHNMVDTLLAQIHGRLNSGDLAHTTLDDFNDFVKSGQFAEKANRERRAKEMANMPSMRDPKAVSDFLRTVSGGARRDFSLAMDKERWRDAGMPMVGQTRVAITDPALLRTPSGGMGHRIVRFNTDNLTAPESSLAFKHSTYPVATAGEYVGDVPMLPRHYVMPTAQDQMMQTLANDSSVIHPLSVNSKGRDSARKFFEEQQLVQPIDEDFLHSVNEGMRRKSIYGFRKGGSVVKLARDVLFQKRDAA